jgi:hypothetical protein
MSHKFQDFHDHWNIAEDYKEMHSQDEHLLIKYIHSFYTLGKIKELVDKRLKE